MIVISVFLCSLRFLYNLNYGFMSTKITRLTCLQTPIFFSLRLGGKIGIIVLLSSY